MKTFFLFFSLLQVSSILLPFSFHAPPLNSHFTSSVLSMSSHFKDAPISFCMNLRHLDPMCGPPQNNQTSIWPDGPLKCFHFQRKMCRVEMKEKMLKGSILILLDVIWPSVSHPGVNVSHPRRQWVETTVGGCYWYLVGSNQWRC